MLWAIRSTRPGLHKKKCYYFLIASNCSLILFASWLFSLISLKSSGLCSGSDKTSVFIIISYQSLFWEGNIHSHTEKWALILQVPNGTGFKRLKQEPRCSQGLPRNDSRRRGRGNHLTPSQRLGVCFSTFPKVSLFIQMHPFWGCPLSGLLWMILQSLISAGIWTGIQAGLLACSFLGPQQSFVSVHPLHPSLFFWKFKVIFFCYFGHIRPNKLNLKFIIIIIIFNFMCEYVFLCDTSVNKGVCTKEHM